jgi:carboxyl-terminal processing protease
VARATEPYDGLERFARMLTAIESDYVESRHADQLLDAAVDGMVSRLDPHSRWMSAEAVAALEADAEGEAVGFGLELAVKEGAVVVLDVEPDSPAQSQGVQPGDRILSIDGVGLQGLPLAEVEDHFEGDHGQPAALEILREGWDRPQRLAAARGAVRTPGTESALFGDVAYVRIVDFQRDCAHELGLDLARLTVEADGSLRGVILDLRDNTGGLLSEAVAVADHFLDEGPIVSVRGRSRSPEVHEATPGGIPADVPVRVLVDGLTASASEIVAGALQTTGRARLVGRRTYGKGSVQQLYRNPDGSALKLTVARYHLPNGAPITSKEGLQPDVFVAGGPDAGTRELLRKELLGLDLPADRREQLLHLLEGLQDRPSKRVRHDWRLSVEERGTRDPDVLHALADL